MKIKYKCLIANSHENKKKPISPMTIKWHILISLCISHNLVWDLHVSFNSALISGRYRNRTRHFLFISTALIARCSLKRARSFLIIGAALITGRSLESLHPFLLISTALISRHPLKRLWYLLSVTTTLISRRPLKGVHRFLSTDSAWISRCPVKWECHLPPVCRLDGVVTLDSIVVLWRLWIFIKHVRRDVLQYQLLLHLSSALSMGRSRHFVGSVVVHICWVYGDSFWAVLRTRPQYSVSREVIGSNLQVTCNTATNSGNPLVMLASCYVFRYCWLLIVDKLQLSTIAKEWI